LGAYTAARRANANATEESSTRRRLRTLLGMSDWSTAASLATAGGTLILAVATFVSVRSANRAARIAEESLLASMRPLLVPSRLDDPMQKVGFVDGHFARVAGSGGTAEIADDGAVYLTMSVRNVGQGIAVLLGWRLEPNADFRVGRGTHPPVETFRPLTRDLYIPAGDVGFWQGAIRDHDDPDLVFVTGRITARERFVIDVLYGDHTGGQRVISRFSLQPRSDEGWLATVGLHWNVDRPDPK